MKPEKKVILLAGPTASGKSKLAIKLAKNLNGEIINADSMQVYDEILILTSRPKSHDINIVKHHLYGFNSVRQQFSTGHWLNMAINKMKEEILKQIPLSRFGRAEEVAQLIEFLITDEASYITGQTIHIYGGLYM